MDERDERIAELEGRLAAKDAQLVARDVRIAELEQQVTMLLEQVAALTKQVAVLTEKLGQNSRNSHLPPSSDPPGSKRGKGKQKSRGKRKRGGQKGHKGNRRELLPEAAVDEVIDFFPPQCENCWKSLPQVRDPAAKRYQMAEMPPIKPHTTEYRRHAVMCPDCGYKTRASYDEEKIPASPFGPRLMSIVALLTGVYHVSRRRTGTLMSDLLGVRISLGAISAVEGRVSEAVVPAVAEAWDQVRSAEVKHTDGTSWLQSATTLSLWTIATKMATVFKVIADGSTKTLAPLFGVRHGILVSDRATALNFWAMNRRQICWAHLLRKFIAFSERDGPAGDFGRELLDCTALIFGYWHDYKGGKLSREKFLAWMTPLQAQMEAVLARAEAAGVERLSGSCANILAHKQALWTFVARDDVEPTNNHAERELRAFVLWRKRSFGTQSVRGNLFAERLMTVSHTARKQNKNVLTFLTACCEAQRTGDAAPSLFTPALTAVA